MTPTVNMILAVTMIFPMLLVGAISPKPTVEDTVALKYIASTRLLMLSK